ncbi:AcvB/VirJ family lysyl-phosphatidylglycerol hydrolase [Mucilaginibacter sp. L3T2-6]|uniref:AcvB/VirJ family lysyl-phosphatidylglycerol hydrolase n=1 Tax=Mucilaginibacter sp. L3T2-6 TaxID=3062491 RepID=UPI002676A0E9|nr:AcvB/VirJ family lysyl-phosphatidylglycerol hydrolase [Mucilaginibacter sp. L3T2-6]MDO3645029.1 AcvB/VirJ family lysyl-phosphatidylglycerol hydrolase [Mucilaginibacter sp. L3T2-6]MDV6217480.1 AcvB/VirJ family lysyl-phosphatidylglycerol hydrolase [Mucilaginibacter sp. L3T2-6]
MVANSGAEREDFGLPLIIYQPADTTSSKMVVLLSGDGGWLGFNDTLAVGFAKRGYHVIGFNSRTYFWHQKSPEQTADDLAKLISKYNTEWKIRRIVLNGFSFGADVVPFIYNRLRGELKTKIYKLQLLSPFLSTDFKVHLADLIGDGDDNRTYKVKDEVEKITIPILCFYGKDEQPKPLADIRKPNFSVTIVPGGHHYRNGYHQIISSARRRYKY